MRIFRPCFIFFLLGAVALTCKKPVPDPSGEDQKESKKGTPIEVVDGKVRFFAERSGDPSKQILAKPEDFTGCTARVNGKDYTLLKDASGNWYCDVESTVSNSYSAVLLTSKSSAWFGSTAYKDVKVPYSQFYQSTLSSMSSFPLYAEYSESTGNVLSFAGGFSLLDLVVSGNANLTSVKVKAVGGERIAGIAAYLPSKRQFQISEGLDFVVLNCMGAGAGTPIKDKNFHLFIPVIPGNLSQGLEITLCDKDHRMMTWYSGPVDLKANEVKSFPISYKPEDDLLWFEGFDNFVWGGDPMSGEKGKGFAPDAQKIGIEGGRNRKGTADAFAPVSFDTPGTGFIQSNTWADVNGKTIGASHAMDNSYVLARNLEDWKYMFRCMEWQVYVSVGIGNTGRGILQTPAIGTLEGMSAVTVSFDFCFQNGATDDLQFEIAGGGVIRSCLVDGKDIGAAPTFSSASSSVVITRKAVPAPSSLAEVKTWHHAVLEVDRATDGLNLYFAGCSTDSGAHGVWIDNLMVRKGQSEARKGNLRVLYWNIQNGMWADQHNNYNNFVKWVKKYDPDICVWCEAASIYKNNTNQSAPSSDRFLPDGWATLAARYGHSYVALSGKRDNYPQETTSKYPIKTLLRITDTDVSGRPVAHGAAIQQIEVNGRKINIVTCHMWPQAYGFGVSGDAAREASKEAHEGDYYRQFEMQYIVSHTVNDPKYANEDWLLMGDLNSRSRLDNWYYNYSANDTKLITQDVILEQTNLVDIIAETWKGSFCSSTYGNSRIDFMYASPSMMGRVVDAGILIDKWTSSRPSTYVSSFYDPSDHRPILVDFDLSK